MISVGKNSSINKILTETEFRNNYMQYRAPTSTQMCNISFVPESGIEAKRKDEAAYNEARENRNKHVYAEVRVCGIPKVSDKVIYSLHEIKALNRYTNIVKYLTKFPDDYQVSISSSNEIANKIRIYKSDSRRSDSNGFSNFGLDSDFLTSTKIGREEIDVGIRQFKSAITERELDDSFAKASLHDRSLTQKSNWPTVQSSSSKDNHGDLQSCTKIIVKDGATVACKKPELIKHANVAKEFTLCSKKDCISKNGGSASGHNSSTDFSKTVDNPAKRPATIAAEDKTTNE